MPYVPIGKENSADVDMYYKDLGQRVAGGVQPRLALSSDAHLKIQENVDLLAFY
jgi:hypothetical protein